MKNTGLQYVTSWHYKLGNKEIGECRLLRPAGDSFYSDAEVALLTEQEYREAFSRTAAYMSRVLKWAVTPDPGDSCRENQDACPL